MKTYRYPATFEAGDEPGIVVVSFIDVPEAITEGDDTDQARENAADALGHALLTYLRVGRSLPKPGNAGDNMILPPADIVAKLALLETFAGAGITRTELARRLGKDEKQVRRILDPMHGTDIATLEAAISAMGGRLVIGLEAA